VVDGASSPRGIMESLDYGMSQKLMKNCTNRTSVRHIVPHFFAHNSGTQFFLKIRRIKSGKTTFIWLVHFISWTPDLKIKLLGRFLDQELFFWFSEEKNSGVWPTPYGGI
jgi:hypothetical protein